MNAKAKKFSKMLKENKMDFFQEEEMKDDLKTVLFRSHMEIAGQRLPLVIVIDDSIYTICRTLIAGKCLNDDNRAEVLSYLNELNFTYKSFKFYATQAGEIVLDACILNTNENFEPDMVRAIIDLSVKNLTDNYRMIMKKVWGNTEEKSQTAAE
jgi:hypothetical protein